MAKPIAVLTQDIELVASISNYESLVFENMWHGVGIIELRINRYKKNSDAFQKDRLIIVDDSGDNVYIILHREVELDESGRITENWLIKGMQLKFVLSDRITLPPEHTSHDNKSGSAELVMKHYVERNAISPTDPNRRIPILVNEDMLNRGSSVVWQSRFQNLAEELINISSFTGIGWNVGIDLKNSKWVFRVMEGKDRSIDQDINSPVIFSPHLGNVSYMKFVDSSLNHKNYAYVAGQGEGVERRVLTVGASTGLNRRELFVDARDIAEETDDDVPVQRPLAEIEADLRNRGEQKLSELQQELFLEAQVMARREGVGIDSIQGYFITQFQTAERVVMREKAASFEYGRDWFLGDIVTTQNTDWGYTLNTRITIVREIYEEGGSRLEVVFGNDRPTLIDKIRQQFAQISPEVRR